MGERDIIVRLTKLLKGNHVTYIMTGSFAVSYWGYPRATHDIDFVVELKTTDLDSIINVIKSLGRGFDFDKDQIKLAINDRFFFNVFHDRSGIKIDFWVSKDEEFDKEKFHRKVVVKLFGEKVFIISAEDLILTKLLWNKGVFSERHQRDCVGIWQVQKGKLDMTYLNKWAERLGVTKLLKGVQTSSY